MTGNHQKCLQDKQEGMIIKPYHVAACQAWSAAKVILFAKSTALTLTRRKADNGDGGLS